MWRQGLVAGLLGAAAVAIWFLVFDMLSRQAFFTPAALGSAVLGASGPEEVTITAGTVLLYTVIHVIGFVALATIASAFISGAERDPSLLVAFFIVFATHAPLFIGVAWLFREWVLEALGFWAVIAGAAIGAVTIVWYLLAKHPNVRNELRHPNSAAIHDPGQRAR